MREHLMMYMKSQTNDSPYGRFDHGKMVDIREAYRERVFRIIESFDSPISLSADEEKELIVEWGKWLSEKIEPSEATEKGLVVLRNRFSTLPQETKEAWFSAMKTTLKEYEEWAQEMREAISELSEEELELPVIGDVRKII